MSEIHDLRPVDEALRQSFKDCKTGAVVARADGAAHACYREACENVARLAVTLTDPASASPTTYLCADHWTPLKCLLTDLDYSIIYTEDGLDQLWEELGCPIR